MPVIVSNNKAKDWINIQCTKAFTARMGRALHYYHAVNHQGGQIIEHGVLKDHLKNLHMGKIEQRLGLLPLVIGMPVMICANFDVCNEIVNGCTGTLEEVRYTTDNDGNHHTHACIISLPDSQGSSLTNLSIGEVLVLEDTCAMMFTNPHSHKRCSIKCT